MDERLISALNYIPPSDTHYDDWLHIGMACEDAGLPCEVWDDWSSRDHRPGEYVPGLCAEKWATFGKASGEDKVTEATIYKWARAYGWKEASGHPIPFDGVIRDDGIDHNESTTYSGTRELIEFLDTLFRPDEYVSFSYKSYEDKDGKWKPGERCYGFTEAQLVESLKKNPTDIRNTIYDYNKDAGAWITINPVDGQGGKDANVTDYRYALVESDNLPIPDQEEIYRKYRLPIATLVYSGSKSIHAIVRVEAKDKAEYEERVQYLYSFLERNGIRFDEQNKNPSRLSRMAGVDRGDRHQSLLDTNIGCKSWTKWIDFIEGRELPPILSMDDCFENLPPLLPVQIDGMLRRGHKMLISGPSKAGKSFLLMELCVSLSCGLKWLGHQCTQGVVLYVNLEIDDISARYRFKAICEKMGVDMATFRQNCFMWSLRGRGKPLKDLVPDLIDAVNEKIVPQGKHLDAIVLDPIYKVIMGDENNATEMGQFCNQLDRIAALLNCSVIYCHHHSKGMQGMKKAMDRASGSGVFARDPDALLDITPIDMTDEVANKFGDHGRLPFRVETIYREFASEDTFDIWFDYPIHETDDKGILKECPVEGERKADIAKRGPTKEETVGKVFAAFNKQRNENNEAKISEVAKELQKTTRTLQNYIDDECAAFFYRDKNNTMYLRLPEQTRKILNEGADPKDL